jgi:transcriptional regulator with XRE-family HTH domain
LRERGMSIRALAAEVGVSDGHLSRVIRGANYKSASGDLAGRVAEAFGLPRDYFPEYREDFVINAMRRDGHVRDATYDRLK